MAPWISRKRNSKRIVMLQPQAEAAGAQEQSRILAIALEKIGYTVVHVFLFRRTGAYDGMKSVIYCARERPSGPLAIFSLIMMFARLIGTLWKIAPDAILTFQHSGNIYGSVLARIFTRTIVIASANSAPEHMSSRLWKLDRALGSAGFYDRVIVNSADTEASYTLQGEKYAKRIRRVDHGFELKTTSLSRDDARRNFGIPNDAVVCGTLARLNKVKGIDSALVALSKIPGTHLIVAGQGQEEAALHEMARSLGIANFVHFVGEISPERVGDFFVALDVFLFPSRVETFGLAAAEAAAFGVPVVARDLPVLKEVLGSAALFVDCDDEAEFAAAIVRAHDRPVQFADGQEILRSKYSIERMAEGYDRAIEEAYTS